MADVTTCPRCGGKLPADAPAGVCPKCLMGQALETTVGQAPMPARQLEAGDAFGPYRIERLLGSGGMGRVYAASHPASGRRVALKVLNHRLESREHRQRFLREGRLAASVNHPHSIYIFGTEEIEGVPVISMELASGGTLQDRVRRGGPLPVGEAVDAVLQMIDGLEAAESAGVLHRDVKPSNCFLGEEGTVKVGDFGLSISTALRAETNLTQSGVFLGTPAFSSPEQLRGDELDVRSDIYSVGVTLFYLLTGRPPFEGQQLVQLLATVLEQPAPSCAELRSGIPGGLAKVVQRCLEKRPAQRFGGYDELRHALLPYASTAPTPATLGLRLLAYFIDALTLAVLAATLPLLWTRDLATWNNHFQALLNAEPSQPRSLMVLGILGVLLQVAYFVLQEGLWGTTVGKAICRLRVATVDRGRPGISRGLVRATCFLATGIAPWWLGYALDWATGGGRYEAWSPGLLAVSMAAAGLLFATARRRNGFAGAHDLLSGTRVVNAPAHQCRPVLDKSTEELPEHAGERMAGPYHVLGPLAGDERFLLGYDPRLLRKVWIRTSPAEAPMLPGREREVSRGGRLRWLDGQRTPEGGWDAFEALSGKPLLQLIRTPQPWDAVRFWLLDLAEELQASLQEAALPSVLDLDRVWITAEGRAKLLGFRPPHLPQPAATCHTDFDPGVAQGDVARAQCFLIQVAMAALHGRPLTTTEAAQAELDLPLPLAARTLLDRLTRHADLSLPVDDVRTLTQQPAGIGPVRRASAFAACFLLPAACAALLTSMYFVESRVVRTHPRLGQLAGYLDVYQSLDEQDPRRQAVEVLVASEFRGMVADTEVWSQPAVEHFLSDLGGRQLVEEMVARRPRPTEGEVGEAVQLLAPYYYEIHVATNHFYSAPLPVVFFALSAAFTALFAMLPGLLGVVFTGQSLLLRSLDIAVVTKTGDPASRLRLLGRATLFWTLVAALFAVLITAAAFGRLSIGPGVLVVWFTLAMTAERSLPDRLAGTWLVPR